MVLSRFCYWYYGCWFLQVRDTRTYIFFIGSSSDIRYRPRTRPYVWVAGVRVALIQALNIQFRIYLDTLCTHHLTLPYHWGRKWVMLSQGKPLEFVLKTSCSPTSYLIFSDANNGYIIPIPIFGIPSGNRIPYHFSAGQGNEVTSDRHFRSTTSGTYRLTFIF